MLFAKVQDKKSLEDNCLLQGALRVFIDDHKIVRSKSEFDSCLNNNRAEFCERVIQVTEFLNTLLKQYHEVQRRLSGRIDLQAVTVLNDIKQQLAHLFPKYFLADVPWQYLNEYPRYLKAIVLRLDKYMRELPRQKLLSDQLQQYWQQYDACRQQDMQNNCYSVELEAYRWLLEEYRVSQFAQQLGTKTTVSEKRLKQHWQALKAARV